MNKPTIEDVARKAGVSKGTVSAVINNRSTIKASTRELILKVIKDLNYRPKGFARILKGRNSEKSVGLITRSLDNPFYTSIAMGIKHYANTRGYVLLVACSESNHENERTISQLFSNKDVNGVIISPIMDGTIEIDHLFRLKSINYPFVLLEHVPGIDANVVSIDNLKATENAVKYLLECGHTKIIHFTGPDYASHTTERITGFRSAFSESKFIFNDKLLVKCGSNFNDGYETGLKYFGNITKEEWPTAVICYNDVVALGLISALKELSICVPEDISIIGTDDINISRFWSPKLSTISVPLEELGQIAAEILINSIESHQAVPTIQKILDSKLIIRESCKDLRQS